VRDGSLFVPGSSNPRIPGSRHLLFERPGYHRTNQEVLLRVRLPNQSIQGQTRKIGAAVGVDFRIQPGNSSATANYLGVNAGIFGRQTGSGSSLFAFDLDPAPLGGQPAPIFSELPNTTPTQSWSWIRLRQQPNLAPGEPDVFAKIWADDGMTPEPNGWLEFDYASRPEDVRSGFAGIAGINELLGNFVPAEVDYVAILAAGLPDIVMNVDGFKPPEFTVQPRSASGLVGEYVHLNPLAWGDGPLDYQWQHNGRALEGAHSRSLTLGPLLRRPKFSDHNQRA
jgi:hypothetical protein